MKLNLQKLNVPPLYVPVLVYFLSFGLWMFAFYSKLTSDPMAGRFGAFVESYLPSDSLIAYLISYLLMVLSSVLIAQMNSKFAFIRTRTFIPSLIFVTTTVCWVGVHGNYLAYAAGFFVLITIFLSLESYKNKLAVEPLFLGSFSLGLGTMLVPDFVFLLPFFWIGYFFLKSLSPRSFLASLFGFLTPWLLLVGLRYFLFEDTELLTNFQEFIYTFTIFNYEDLLRVVYSVIIVLILVFTLIQMSFNLRHESVQTQDEINFLKVLSLGVAVLAVFRFSHYASFLPLAAFFLAVFTGYSFTLIKSKLNSYLFLLLLLSGVAYLLFSAFISYFLT